MVIHAQPTIATDLPVYLARRTVGASIQDTTRLIRAFPPKGAELTSHQPYLGRRQ